MSTKRNAVSTERTIKTKYLFQGSQVHLASAKHANSAVLRCVNNMYLNIYGADVAEVWDDYTGELYAQVVRRKNNKVEIVWSRDANYNYVTAYDPIRLSVHAFLK